MISCSHTLRAVVVFGKNSHVRLHPVDNMLDELLGHCREHDYFTTAESDVDKVPRHRVTDDASLTEGIAVLDDY